MTPRVAVLRLDTELPLPAPAHPGDAGSDLRARHPVRLEAGERAVVATGVAVAIPEGYAGLVLPRSGLAARHGIGVVNSPGLIDAGYRGEIKVVLVNHGAEAVELERGDRIAQLLIVGLPGVVFEEAAVLEESVRGAAGFGSTGTG